jgi:hypothetical protein
VVLVGGAGVPQVGSGEQVTRKQLREAIAQLFNPKTKTQVPHSLTAYLEQALKGQIQAFAATALTHKIQALAMIGNDGSLASLLEKALIQALLQRSPQAA